MEKTLKTKTCSFCKTRRNIKNFHKNKSSKDGYHHYCKKCKNDTRTIKRKSNDIFRVAQNKKQKLSKYGLTSDQFNNFLLIQNYSCAICGNSFKKESSTFIDHSHSNGKVRGLLCPKCNALLGLANDDPSILSAAIQYLNSNS